jgi:hypothetical protein
LRGDLFARIAGKGFGDQFLGGNGVLISRIAGEGEAGACQRAG